MRKIIPFLSVVAIAASVLYAANAEAGKWGRCGILGGWAPAPSSCGQVIQCCTPRSSRSNCGLLIAADRAEGWRVCGCGCSACSRTSRSSCCGYSQPYEVKGSTPAPVQPAKPAPVKPAPEIEQPTPAPAKTQARRRTDSKNSYTTPSDTIRVTVPDTFSPVPQGKSKIIGRDQWDR